MWTLTTDAALWWWNDLVRAYGRKGLERVEHMLASMARRVEVPIPEGRHARNLWLEDLPTRAWYDPSELPWIDALQTVWCDIEAELSMLLREPTNFRSYIGGVVSKRPRTSGLLPPEIGWTAYAFCRDGQWDDDKLALCPATAAALHDVPTGCGDVMFSMLAPRSEIISHHGLDNVNLTCHLGLRVPQRCGFVVDGETRHWEEGRCVVFDDTFLHSAWNSSGQARVVLLMDVWHPDLSDKERAALSFLFPRLKRLNPPSTRDDRAPGYGIW